MKRFLKGMLYTILIVVLVFVGILYFSQHKLIWFARPYGPDYKRMLPAGAVELHHTTSQGEQCAFYLPPATDPQSAPERLWVLFCGNGSRALDWTDLILRDPDKRDGFLLIDYPGYGLCQGSAEPANIQESADGALAVLAADLHTTVSALEPRLNVLCHSIGCAAGLQFAVHHPVNRIILAAPFTSLRDMARRSVGWPLCYLLRSNFDNRARIAELAERATPPRVIIFHGTDDTLIPPAMGRELAALAPRIATFREVPDAGHNTIVMLAQDEIIDAMNAP